MKRLPLLALALALVSTLVALAPLSTPAVAAGASDDRWVVVHAPDQVLRHGCRDYRFDYRVDVPGDAWMLELFLVGPNGAHLASATYDSAAQKASDHRSFRVCATGTRAGVHVIRAKVSSYVGRERTVRQVAPTRFRLSRG